MLCGTCQVSSVLWVRRCRKWVFMGVGKVLIKRWVPSSSSLCTSPGGRGAQAFFGELYWFVWFWVVLVLLLLRFLLRYWASPWCFGCWLLLSGVCLGCRRIFLCCIPYTHLLGAGLRSPPGHAFGSPPARHMLCRYGSGICFCSSFSLATFLIWLWR